jgi:hypothetical protein
MFMAATDGDRRIVAVVSGECGEAGIVAFRC